MGEDYLFLRTKGWVFDVDALAGVDVVFPELRSKILKCG